MTSLSRMLLDTFYSLLKECGTIITFTKVGKADVNPDTGSRDTTADMTFPLPAVLTPVSHTTAFLAKLLGRTEKINSVFMIRVSDLPVGVNIESGDYFSHGGLKYRNLVFEEYGNVVIELTGDTFT